MSQVLFNRLYFFSDRILLWNLCIILLLILILILLIIHRIFLVLLLFGFRSSSLIHSFILPAYSGAAVSYYHKVQVSNEPSALFVCLFVSLSLMYDPPPHPHPHPPPPLNLLPGYIY